MEKIKLEKTTRVTPMPMVIVGAMVGGRPNYLAVAWVCNVNRNPPMIGVALGKGHYTNRGIREHKEFSISVPGLDLLKAVDYVGLVSGARADKSRVFESFQGELSFAPMVRACPLCAECKLVSIVDLPTNDFFIGEIANIYSEERFLTDGKPDTEKLKPFLLTMPEKVYWAVGGSLGAAWSAGKGFVVK